MPAIHVSRSITINKPLKEVRTFLKNFHHWPAWSPWLIMEPDATLTYKGVQGEVGASYAWQGERIGAGSITLSGASEGSIELDLTFLKPFKSKAKTRFVLSSSAVEPEPVDAVKGSGIADATKVTWEMHGTLPVFLFFMKKAMTSMVGMDYDRGLAMLKRQLETGNVPSKLTLVGKRKQGKKYYVSVSKSATLTEMGEVWEKGLTELYDALESQNIEAKGTPFGLYKDMNKKTTVSHFEICVPVNKRSKVRKPLSKGKIKACKTFVVQHKGAYEFMGNAWTMAYMAARLKKIKTKKSPMGMEFYLNDPMQIPEEELLAEVVLFCK